MARPALLAPTPASPLRLIDGARRLPNDGFPIGFPAEPLGGRTAGAWSYRPPRRNVLAVGERGATFSSHVTSIAAEVVSWPFGSRGMTCKPVPMCHFRTHAVQQNESYSINSSASASIVGNC